MTKINWVTKASIVLLLWATAAVALPAQTLTTLFSFDAFDGENPYGELIQGTDGNLYGTTYGGGAYADGTVFKITPNGTLTTLHSFVGADGQYPYAGLVLATNGDFYGTTFFGGAGDAGTVFKITPSGMLTTLHSFAKDGNGIEPLGGVVQRANGDFYGTTYSGGASGAGTVFTITPSGTLTTLYSFCSQGDCTDGTTPYAALVQGSDGDFYGTTYLGGTDDHGTVFTITPSGTLTTLHSFGVVDGKLPYAGLIQGTDGDFYGTTYSGGANGVGTVFRITPNGALTTLHSFVGTDGDHPYAGLVQGTDGNFYGTTRYGGANQSCIAQGFDGCGTLFEITPSGTLTTLHSFDETDGKIPEAGLVQSTNGEFYGTSFQGGTVNGGTVFSLNVGLGQFVETLPTSGKVGAAVKILGSFLTGATSVTFNGTAATFTVNSKSEITTTVPTGASTGTVQVMTPRLGTLSSNVPFTVRP